MEMRRDLNELASMLFPDPADVVREGLGGILPPTYEGGVALADSEGGAVRVLPDGTVTTWADGDPDGTAEDAADPDAEAAEPVTVPCTANVREGDRVLLVVQDGAYVDCMAAGWGDRVAATATAAADLAAQAEAIASAIGQYAWNDANGTHVSTEEAVAEGTRNILMNSAGILLRAAANYLAALTYDPATQSGAIAFYDGNGNTPSDIVAAFGTDGAQVGTVDGTHLTVDGDTVDVVDPDEGTLLSMGWDAAMERAFMSSPHPVAVEHVGADGYNAWLIAARDRVGSSQSDQRTVSGFFSMTAQSPNSTWAGINGVGYYDPSTTASYGEIRLEVGDASTSNDVEAYISLMAAKDVVPRIFTDVNTVILAKNNAAIQGTDTDGTTRANLAMVNSNGNIILGSTANSGATRIYGNNVDVVVASGGKFRMGTAAPVVYEDKPVTVSSTTHGTNFTTTVSVAKTGYTTVGVVGWWWDSGTRQNFFNSWGIFTNGDTLYVRLCNLHGTQAASGVLKARILYVRNEMA